MHILILKGIFHLVLFMSKILNVATLALGLQPKQGLPRLRAKKKAWESCRMLPGVQENVRE